MDGHAHSASRRLFSLAFSAAAIALLGACATLPAKRDLPPISTPEQLASRASLAAPEAAWPSDRWWAGFGDRQLDALIAEGLEGATDLRVAEARFARAEALVRQTRSQLLPSLTGAAEGGVVKQSYNYLIPGEIAPRGWPDYGQATLRLDWQLDFWGRNRAALAAARSEAEATAAEAAAARLAVSAGIAAAYADLTAFYSERDSAENAVRVRGRTLELLQGRRAEGLENNGPVERARSAFATAQGELRAVEENLDLTRNRIAVLLGAGPDRGRSIGRPAPRADAGFGLPANLPAELIGRRPDIIAARLRTEAAASRINVARGAFYPSINLVGLIGLQALGVENVFMSGSSFGSAGPALTLPIFDGGRLSGQYRAAEADYQAAVAQYDGALAQALREVADAVSSERALGERLDRAREAERAANSAWMVANNRYRGGLATYLDVLVAEDALIASRRTLASLQARAFALDIALIRALGGGFRS